MFSQCQYGFRPKHALQLHDHTIRLDINKNPFSIFIDLSKAFDTIDHTILIKKMKYYGIEHESCNLLISYLTNKNAMRCVQRGYVFFT